MAAQSDSYPARLNIDYPEKLDRVTTFFRLIWAIPIVIVLSILSATSTSTVTIISRTGETVTKVTQTGGGIVAGLFLATMLLIVFREHYPRWWFDFAREFTRFATRVYAYLALLTDQYPSTVDQQSVHLEIDYPDVKQDLNRWLPLVKWLLVLPHVVVLVVLAIGDGDSGYRPTRRCSSRTAIRHSPSDELKDGIVAGVWRPRPPHLAFLDARHLGVRLNLRIRLP